MRRQEDWQEGRRRRRTVLEEHVCRRETAVEEEPSLSRDNSSLGWISWKPSARRVLTNSLMNSAYVRGLKVSACIITDTVSGGTKSKG